MNGLFLGTSNELGGFESGVTAALLGPVGSALLGGVGAVVTVLIVYALWPQLRTLRELEA